MAIRILGPTGSRRRRRMLVLGPIVLLFALLLPTLVFASAVPSTGGAVNDPRFEFDGNLLTEALEPGVLDWANPGNVTGHSAVITNASRVPAGQPEAGSCTGSSTNPANFTLGGTGTVGQGLLVCDGTISKQTPNDANAFTQGQHEDEGENPINWVIKAASSPKKTDLSEVYVYGKVFDSPFDPDLLANNLLFIFDTGRLDTNGDFHVDFEMNQEPQTDCGDTGQGSDFTFCQPRTVNDVLVSYDSVGGTSPPEASVFLWKTELDEGESCESSQGDINSPTLGGCYVLLDAPPAADGFQAAQGVFNTTEIDAAPWKAVVCDPTSIESSQQCTIRSKIPAGGNMEGYIDVEGFVDGFSLCPGFGQISAKSRSSSGINASLQDTTGALPIQASICGSILIHKETGAAQPLPGAEFTISPDVLTRAAGSSTVVADGGTGDEADGNDGVVCVDNVLFGEYLIEETGVPTGWFGDTSKTVNVTDPATCADRLAALDDPDATFVNRQGSILVAKENAAGQPLSGAGFTFTPNPFTGGATGIEVADGSTDDHADANDGFVCIDNVRPGTYTVTETTVPVGFFGDGDSEQVVVDSPSTCAERLAAADDPDAVFTNLKGSIIIRKEAKDASTEATNDLFGGASFKITPDPTTGAAGSSLTFTDNQALVDQFATDGLICIDNVVNLAAGLGGGSFTIEETASNDPDYAKDDDKPSVTVTAASTCTGRGSDGTPDATFQNTPLSEFVINFNSLADGLNGPATVARITCTGLTPSEGDNTPNALDDDTETYTNLLPLSPATYDCEIEIDP